MLAAQGRSVIAGTNFGDREDGLVVEDLGAWVLPPLAAEDGVGASASASGGDLAGDDGCAGAVTDLVLASEAVAGAHVGEGSSELAVPGPAGPHADHGAPAVRPCRLKLAHRKVEVSLPPGTGLRQLRLTVGAQATTFDVAYRGAREGARALYVTCCGRPSTGLSSTGIFACCPCPIHELAHAVQT